MGFFKTLFTGREETEEEKKEHDEKSQFDIFKYDGIQALRMGQTDYAIACFEHALDIKDDIETQQFYASTLMRKGDLEGATEAFVELNRIEGEGNVETMLTLADLYFQQEDYEKMGGMCDAVMAADDSLATPYYYKACMQNAQNDLFNAVASATIAITKREDFNNAYLLRAKILCRMQQFAEAEKDIDHLIGLGLDEDDEIMMMKAEICDVLGKKEDAKTFYRKVIELNPYTTKAYMQLGNILHEEGNSKEAAALVEEGLKLAPEEMQNITGEYTNFEKKMLDAYDAINPFK